MRNIFYLESLKNTESQRIKCDYFCHIINILNDYNSFLIKKLFKNFMVNNILNNYFQIFHYILYNNNLNDYSNDYFK